MCLCHSDHFLYGHPKSLNEKRKKKTQEFSKPKNSSNKINKQSIASKMNSFFEKYRDKAWGRPKASISDAYEDGLRNAANYMLNLF